MTPEQASKCANKWERKRGKFHLQIIALSLVWFPILYLCKTLNYHFLFSFGPFPFDGFILAYLTIVWGIIAYYYQEKRYQQYLEHKNIS